MGKKLFLGPGKSGQITPKAVDHPPLQALVESGELELIADLTSRGRRGPAGGSSSTGAQNHTPGKDVFRSGDG
ncbi:MAG: hypothetical protein ACI8TQ_003030 [Planctomycetota bacterium]|jgi:hypothetical protein